MSDPKTLADALKRFGYDPTIDRGAILPLGRNSAGDLVFAAPEMAVSLAKALMLPGHVATGGDYTESDVTDMAANIAGGGLIAPRGGALRGALRAAGGPINVAKNMKIGHNLPHKSPRPFDADYKNGALTDDAGKLLQDIEGRPLTAPFIAGRRSAAGLDEALQSQDVVEGAARSIGSIPAEVSRSELPRGSVGAYIVERWASGPERFIRYDKNLPTEDATNVIAHEFGHAIRPPRPFDADYKNGALTDDAGKLLQDIEGRPLTAPFIAGRRSAAGLDEALQSQDVVEGAARLTGSVLEGIPRSAIPRRSAGAYLRTPGETGPKRRVIFDEKLSDDDKTIVIAHEFGHAIDDIAGNIPTKGLDTELRRLYNTLATGEERERKLTGPQHLGYRADEVNPELMAEALRAYMTNPNAMKTVAPNVAARIRKHVNTDPHLSKIIQFNVGGGVPLPLPMWEDEGQT